MAEEVKKTKEELEAEAKKLAEAETLKAAGIPPAEGAKTEQPIPYERFQEVVKKRNEAEAKLAQLEKEKNDNENKTLLEQKKFEDLYKKASLELEAAKKQVEEENIKNALIIEAHKQNIIDVDAAYKLLDRDNLKIKDGKVENMKEVVEALVKEKPYLVSKTITYPLGGVPPQGEVTPEAASKMTMEQYAAWRKTQEGK